MGRKVRIKRSQKRSLWPNRAEIAATVGVGVLAAFLAVPMFLPEAVWRLDKSEPVGGDPARGAYIADAAGCATCHTLSEEVPYSGGYAIRTPFGNVIASNITPDPVAGIGRWRFNDFRRAMLLGLSPEGRHYYPAFPYLNYKDMRDGDLADLLPIYSLCRHRGGKWKRISWWRLFRFARPWRSGSSFISSRPAWCRSAEPI